LMANYGIADPSGAWNFFTSGFQSSWLDGGASLTWYLTLVAPLTSTPQQPSSIGTARLIQNSVGSPGNFELVVYEPGNKLVHYYRDNSKAAFPWVGPTATISNRATSSGALIQSSFGNLEVLVLEGNNVVHYYLDSSTNQWEGPTATISTQSTGAPAFIQSDFSQSSGSHGNFEALILEGNNLVYYYRDNSAAGFPWHRVDIITSKATGPGSIIQSTIMGSSGHGNFEVIVPEGNNLVHYQSDNSADGHPWSQGGVISSKVTGPGALIQGSYVGKPGAQSNFEVVAIEGNSLVHYWRDNSDPSLPWNFGAVIDTNAKGPGSLIQGTFGRPDNPGNFEAVVVDNINSELVHWWRNNSNPNVPWTIGGNIAANALG